MKNSFLKIHYKLSNYYRRSLVLLVGHLFLKGSLTSHLIRKSYFYKSLMTLEGWFKSTPKNQPSTSEKKWGHFLVLNVNCFGNLGFKNWQLGLTGFVSAVDCTILRTDTSNSRTKSLISSIHLSFTWYSFSFNSRISCEKTDGLQLKCSLRKYFITLHVK